ncbi:hypothetical protein ES703_81719 [subsurface metagenome]
MEINPEPYKAVIEATKLVVKAREILVVANEHFLAGQISDLEKTLRDTVRYRLGEQAMQRVLGEDCQR